ncbi:MAG TPA: ATP-binding cassette domain-containing protein [Hyphomicrobiales bacterium]|nr:ATP-binding cassette domain-containing protein [Hyphomicrobiales bacterium]
MPELLAVEGLGKAFGGIRAVDGVSFRIERPGIYGLIGPNGAGKTTLFDVLCGRQAADAGEIRFEGRRVDLDRVHRRARRGFARTFQECRVLLEESCRDNVLFAAQDKRLGREGLQAMLRSGRARRAARAEADRLLDLAGLARYAEAPASVLSYGQRRLLEIVSTLMTRPRLLLLDEPASGVNPTLLNALHDFLKRMFAERPAVFIVVEHNMEFIMSLASEIIVMHQGRILERGTPAAIQASRQVIDAYLG